MRRALVCALLALIPGTSSASRPTTWSAAAPGREYATPYVLAIQGNPLMFAQLDPLAPHDLVSVDLDPRTGQPLFGTGSALGFGRTGRVHGVETLESSDYPFFCTLHPWMVGLLLVRTPPP